MDDLTVVALAAMQQDAGRLQYIAQNIANAATPGYRRQMSSPHSFSTELAAAQRDATAKTGAAHSPQRFLDISAGTLRSTANPNDVAIDGGGFFELAGTSGPVYTRRGEFRVDSGGRLNGPGGQPVMGTSGEIVLAGDRFEIAANGDVLQGGAVVARLKIVRFTAEERMEPLGSATYGQGGAVPDDTQSMVRLRAGYLENANVDTAREMVGMTETMRHFEALQKLMQGYDEVLEKGIRKLGEF